MGLLSRRTLRCIEAVLLGILARGVSAEGQESDPITDIEFRLPIDEATSTRVDQLIKALGSPRFADRQQASRELIEIGAAAFRQLRAAYRDQADFEVRSRIETIVQTGFLDFRAYGSFGFLGIQQDAGFTPGNEDDPRIPVGHFGIHINEVHPDTGAERAGLVDNDIVIAVDGKPIQGAGRRAVEWFGQVIRERGPGGRLRLSVLRGTSDPLELEAVLTRPPMELTQRLPHLIDLVRKTELRFPVWWAKHFKTAPTDSQGVSSATESEN